MNIPPRSKAVILVKGEWARSPTLRALVQSSEDSQSPHHQADTYAIQAPVLDDSDAKGLWIEVTPPDETRPSPLGKCALLIPWPQILAVALSESTCPVVWESDDSVGFKKTGL
ncbi:MAG: hypothetical protein EHM80_03280 [Nitrospiraceae bacterium]|nr:MAG: hypothetical protein EHM80_03280 [Nitrospiraceae bacterium]